MTTGDAVIDIANATEIVGFPPELVAQMTSFMTIVQAIGGIFILYLVFNIINAIFNRKKQKE